MVYLWQIPDDYPESLIGDYQRNESPDRFLFKKGEILLENIGLPVIKFGTSLETLREFDCLPSNTMVPLVNAACVTVLSELALPDVQFIKARVLGTDGETNEFSLLNATNKVSGIDREQSKFTYVPGTQHIMSFQKLNYVENCLGSHELARDSDYLSHLLVSESVVKRFHNEGFKGVEFVKPAEVAW